jgi:type IV pilus assembly protein PilB
MKNNKKKRLGEVLVNEGLITTEELNQVLEFQKITGKRLWELLIEGGILEERKIIEVLEFQFGIPYVDLKKEFIDPDVPKLIHKNLARRHLLIPIKEEKERLIVAMADPLNIIAIDDIKIVTGKNVDPVITTKMDILHAIDKYYSGQNAKQAIEDLKKQQNDKLSQVQEESLIEINDAPMVRLVNSLIQQAVLAKASDIHIEPLENRIRIRFRVDGELQEILSSEKFMHSGIVTRMKIMGKMDIAEKRIPQDGRVEMMIDGREIDLRFSIIPTVYGEKVAIRLLDPCSFLSSERQIGFITQNASIFKKIIQYPHGILLVTGPTGSGKTTTLYAILRELNQINKNIITIEDPVEYRLQGINQIQVNNRAGLTFANGLRAILRQDPDVIMIGEIRDHETAKIAIRAANTGHFVLSTMHTNDTVSTISRLVDMGIEPYLVSSCMVGVIAQRLVKKICTYCKTTYQPNEIEQEMMALQENRMLYKGKGCKFCDYTGYQGRTAVHEIMVINKKLRMLIDKRVNLDALKEASIEEGTLTLKENCKQLVLNGITTTEEFIKIAYSLD